MTKLRVAGAGFADAPIRRLRVAGIEMTSVSVPVSRLRVGGVKFAGVARPAFRNISIVSTGIFGSTATVTAILEPGSPTPDTWTFTKIAGPDITLVGTGATRTFKVPAVLPPTSQYLQILVTASIDGAGTSLSAISSVLPCTDWARIPGGEWVGTDLVV